jgi:hypothetical protein
MTSNKDDSQWRGSTHWRDFRYPGGPSKVESVFIVRGPGRDYTAEMFLIAEGGTLYHNWADSQQQWHDWDPKFFGDQKVNKVYGVGTEDQTATELFVIDSQNRLHHNWLDSGGWHDWDRKFFGDQEVTSVFGIPSLNGSTEFFVIDTNGTLYHNWLNGGQWHDDWTPDFGGAPKVSTVYGVPGSPTTGSVEMFIIDTQGKLYHNWLDSSGWRNWDPNFFGDHRVNKIFAIAAPASGHTEVFVIDIDGTLHHNWLCDGGWHGWEPNWQNAPLVKDIAGCGFSLTTDVFVITAKGDLLCNIYVSEGGSGSRWFGHWAHGFTGNIPKDVYTAFATTVMSPQLWVIAES